jgi:hypothetical protein
MAKAKKASQSFRPQAEKNKIVFHRDMCVRDSKGSEGKSTPF